MGSSGKEQSPMGYNHPLHPHKKKRIENRINTKAEDKKDQRGKSTSNIIHWVMENTMKSLFDRENDKDDKKSKRRKDRDRNSVKKKRIPTPMLDMFVDIASKSALKYIKETFHFKDDQPEEDKDNKNENEDTKDVKEEKKDGNKKDGAENNEEDITESKSAT